MNFDSAFVTAILRADVAAVLKAKGLGISTADLDSEEAQLALEFIYDYAAKYQELPAEDLVVGKTGVDLEESSSNAEFWTEEMLNKKLFRKLQTGLNDSTDVLLKGKPKESFASVEELVRDVRRSNLSSAPTESLFKLGPEVLQQYKDIKAGKKGILTRWPTINKATLGFWPQDLVMWVARVATGKTWSSVIIAHDAWAGEWFEWDFSKKNLVKYVTKACLGRVPLDEGEVALPGEPEDKPCGWKNPLPERETMCPACQQVKLERQPGYKVLYITTEISKIRIAQRFYAVRYGLPYGDFRADRLNEYDESKLYKSVDDLYNMEGLSIVGGDFDFSIGALEAAIEETQPDLMVLDGAYLIKGDGKTRTEKAADVFNELKRMVQRYKIAAVITSQLNRSADPKNKETVSTETIALTDVAGWNADMAVGMVQTDDMKVEGRMIFKPLKVREGEGQEIELYWDFKRMCFDELAGQDDDGGGTFGGGDAGDGGMVVSEDDTPF